MPNACANVNGTQHLPHIAPQRFFALYDEANISLPLAPTIPSGFPEAMWFACNEALSYPDWHMDACGTPGGGYSNTSCPSFGIDKPMAAELTRRHRLAYFASLSYTDELIGNIVSALDATPLVQNTVVMMWAGASHRRTAAAAATPRIDRQSLDGSRTAQADVAGVYNACVLPTQTTDGPSAKTMSGASTRLFASAITYRCWSGCPALQELASHRFLRM
jgi:arylsulfatase A-like enzyme